MKVSVLILTYNHERFITQAIESVLMQKSNFNYEIIIGEDDSADKTRDIVKAYKEKYPEKIRLFLNVRKNAIFINGKPTGRWNFVNNLKHAKGQYVALLDGDDYWTDPYKLQKQADLLDSYPDFTTCFHNVMITYEDGSNDSHPYYVQHRSHPSMQQRKPKPISTLADLIKTNLIQTPSVMFRAGLFEEFPAWYYKLDRGDWPLHVLNAQHGDIGYIDEVMAVHRIHRGGIYSSMSLVEKLKGTMEAARVLDKHLNYQYHSEISKRNANILARIINLLESEGDLVQSRAYALKYLAQSGFADKRSQTMLKKVFKGYVPGIYRLLGWGKRIVRSRRLKPYENKN